jgi:hypothetical protein
VEVESILLIVTSIINITIASMVNADITGIPEPSQEVQVSWGCRDEPNGNGGLHCHNVIPIFNDNTAVR